jgi:hypothetical protein
MIHNILLLLASYPNSTIYILIKKKNHIQCKYVGMNFSHKNMGIVIQHVTRVCTNTDLTRVVSVRAYCERLRCTV